jgi:acyl-CoA-binding protein
MNIQTLSAFIDKIQSVTLTSTSDDAAEALKLYHTFWQTLNDEWKAKRQKFFDVAKKIAPENWESLPNDGFFVHLLSGILHAQALCQADSKCDKKATLTTMSAHGQTFSIERLEQNKALNDEALERIKQQYCVKQKRVKQDDLQSDTGSAEE